MDAMKITLVFLLIVMSWIIDAQTDNGVSQWCSRNPLCTSIIKADPRSQLKNSANGIGTIIKDKALADALFTSQKISILLKTIKNREVVEALNDCSQGYARAISALKSVDFSRQDYITLVGAFSDAGDEPRDCEASFPGAGSVPSPIYVGNQNLIRIMDTSLDIVYLRTCNRPSVC